MVTVCVTVLAAEVDVVSVPSASVVPAEGDPVSSGVVLECVIAELMEAAVAELMVVLPGGE
ncbi:hypothetical protein LEMLEM_LOCUS2953 [Lemmus lemmus]